LRKRKLQRPAAAARPEVIVGRGSAKFETPVVQIHADLRRDRDTKLTNATIRPLLDCYRRVLRFDLGGPCASPKPVPPFFLVIALIADASLTNLRELEQVRDVTPTYGGDAALLRLGIQAYALGIAFEFDPYFGLSNQPGGPAAAPIRSSL
jgi:hypothetical protein